MHEICIGGRPAATARHGRPAAIVRIALNECLAILLQAVSASDTNLNMLYLSMLLAHSLGYHINM